MTSDTPYIPVADRGHPDTAATENQRLIDLVASQAQHIKTLERSRSEIVLQLAATEAAVVKLNAEIATLKRAAQDQGLQALSDMAQADDALVKKGALGIPPGWQIDKTSGGSIIVVPPKPGAEGRVVDVASRSEGDRLLYSLANALLPSDLPHLASKAPA